MRRHCRTGGSYPREGSPSDPTRMASSGAGRALQSKRCSRPEHCTAVQESALLKLYACSHARASARLLHRLPILLAANTCKKLGQSMSHQQHCAKHQQQDGVAKRESAQRSGCAPPGRSDGRPAARSFSSNASCGGTACAGELKTPAGLGLRLRLRLARSSAASKLRPTRTATDPCAWSAAIVQSKSGETLCSFGSKSLYNSGMDGNNGRIHLCAPRAAAIPFQSDD